jgi:hypothetical protein
MLDYLLVIFEYYKTSKTRYLVWNFITSISLALLCIYVPKRSDFIDLANGFISNSVGILGVLVGFSISMFTLLNTASNPNIEEIKKKETGYKLYNKPVYLFDLLIISMIYIIIIESLILIFNLLFSFFFDLTELSGQIAFAVNVFLLIHVILVNISTTVDFYFIITKK